MDGRCWKKPYCSFTHPKLRLRDMEALRVHFLFALNLFRALKPLDLDLSIKWPNDLMLGDKKIAGILSKFNITSRVIPY